MLLLPAGRSVHIALQVTYGLLHGDLLLCCARPASRKAGNTEPPTEADAMHKTMIRKLFVGSLTALAGGLVLLAVAGGLAFANSSLVKDGQDVTAIHATPLGWTMIGLAGVAILVLVAAVITQFVAWVGAVINTAQLEDKTWFIVLLVTGLLSFGFIAMIVYLIAGPEDPQPITAVPPITQAASPGLQSQSA
jgi:hypothetical protein